VRKGESWDARGDCVACNQCVADCPTGIDIRDGSQLECIGCGLCIDACNTVMERIGRPGELITYDSINRQEARARGETARYRFVRPRTLMYLTLLLIVGGAIVFGLWSRPVVGTNVLRDRNPLFVRLSDGSIRNGFTFKILNKQRAELAYLLELDGLPGASMSVVGQHGEGGIVNLIGAPDTVTSYHLYVRVPRDRLTGEETPFVFRLTQVPAVDGAAKTSHEATFRGPAK
jgi:cytochrome c oxidase accessory protein FixG